MLFLFVHDGSRSVWECVAVINIRAWVVQSLTPWERSGTRAPQRPEAPGLALRQVSTNGMRTMEQRFINLFDIILSNELIKLRSDRHTFYMYLFVLFVFNEN